MKIDILTTFPEMLEGPLNASIVGRARDAQLLDIRIHNLRDYTHDKHRSTDDEQYGGGDGMVMMAPPILEAVDSLSSEEPKPRIIFPSPQGPLFNQERAEELSREPRLLFICGHYKGIDERALQLTGGEELSIGDYVISGGELAVLVIVDAVMRLIPGVVGSMGSVEEDSFSCGLLDAPRYTRPQVVQNLEVPPILLSGHHQEIAKWRLEQSINRTRRQRPDLFKKWLESNATSDQLTDTSQSSKKDE